MPPAYRDDRETMKARVAELERENAELREELHEEEADNTEAVLRARIERLEQERLLANGAKRLRARSRAKSTTREPPPDSERMESITRIRASATRGAAETLFAGIFNLLPWRVRLIVFTASLVVGIVLLARGCFS